MTILEEVYASAPTDKVLIHTLQVSHDTVGDFYYARSYDDVIAVTEEESEVTFQAVALSLQLPKKGVQGREDLVFTLDNVNGEALVAIDQMMEAGGNTSVIYRSYVSTDLTGPQERIPLVATSASINVSAVSINATFRDFVNKAWPRRRYTLGDFSGLKYL